MAIEIWMQYKYYGFLIFLLVMLLMIWVGWRFFLAGGAGAVQSRSLSHFLKKRENPGEQGFPGADLGGGRLFSHLVRLLVSTWTKSARMRRQALWPVLTLVAVGGIVTATLLLNHYHRGTSFEPRAYVAGEHIKLALMEEKLVPPPPLPPEAFTNAITERPNLSSADRDWSKLTPTFVPEVLAVLERCKVRGYPLVLLEGYRSPERQDALAEQGSHVTRARGGQSKHQYGLAVDLAPIRNGRVVISERDPWAMQAYQVLGEEAEAAGLTWGGRWSFKDYGHIERPGSVRRLAQARN
ncbi:M15 family metallopeptidase [Crenobacter sp. SG2305]|nr:M15 family metallopeptidase [Crenobacter sp. SG2305]